MAPLSGEAHGVRRQSAGPPPVSLNGSAGGRAMGSPRSGLSFVLAAAGLVTMVGMSSCARWRSLWAEDDVEETIPAIDRRGEEGGRRAGPRRGRSAPLHRPGRSDHRDGSAGAERGPRRDVRGSQERAGVCRCPGRARERADVDHPPGSRARRPGDRRCGGVRGRHGAPRARRGAGSAAVAPGAAGHRAPSDDPRAAQGWGLDLRRGCRAPGPQHAQRRRCPAGAGHGQAEALGRAASGAHHAPEPAR